MNAVKNKDFFEEFGLQVTQGEIEVGKTYPIFGMITQFVNDQPGEVIVELNFQIEMKMSIDDPKRINLLKERIFESGIFVSTIETREPKISASCKKVIFGKKQQLNA